MDTQPEFIIIGTILSPWGIHGHLNVEVETDFPQRFSRSSQVYIGRSPVVIDDVGWHKGRAIVKVTGINDEAAAEELRGKQIEVHRSQLYNLAEGEYYHFQLVGMTVETTGGDSLGEITEILTIASADVYVIRGKSGDILVPATDEYVKSVNLEQRIMVIEPVKGLLDLNVKKRENT